MAATKPDVRERLITWLTTKAKGQWYTSGQIAKAIGSSTATVEPWLESFVQTLWLMADLRLAQQNFITGMVRYQRMFRPTPKALKYVANQAAEKANT